MLGPWHGGRDVKGIRPLTPTSTKDMLLMQRQIEVGDRSGPLEGQRRVLAGLFVALIANATPCLQVYNAMCITCRVMSAAAAAQKSVDTSKTNSNTEEQA